MIRWDRIKSIYTEVGFRQSPITDYAIVNADNLISRSGLYFQGASNIVTIKNIRESHQAIELSDEDFNIYLKQLREESVNEVARSVTEDEQDFIQSINLYPYEKTFDTIIDTRGKFVGFEIEPYSGLNTVSLISWVDLAFNEAATFNLYLYNSNKPNIPIQTQEVTTVANESFIVDLNDWYIADSDEYKGGSFYFGYFEDDLGTAKALRKNHDLSNMYVSTKYFDVKAVSLDHTGSTIDVRSTDNESISFGLNIGIEIFKDYTELLIRNKRILSKAIQYQLCEKVLDLIITSTRSNRDNRNNSADSVITQAQFELYGNPDRGINGIKGKLTQSLSKIKKSLFHKPMIRRATLS